MFLHIINWFTFKPWHAENLLYKPKLEYVSTNNRCSWPILSLTWCKLLVPEIILLNAFDGEEFCAIFSLVNTGKHDKTEDAQTKKSQTRLINFIADHDSLLIVRYHPTYWLESFSRFPNALHLTLVNTTQIVRCNSVFHKGTAPYTNRLQWSYLSWFPILQQT